MAMPKKKQVISTIYGSFGPERLRELVLGSDFKTTYLPKGIGLEDIDNGVMDMYLEGPLKVEIDGLLVPVIYMSNERWGEFEKTWQYQDDDKNVLPPFITIRRTGKADGTIHGYKYTLANRKTVKYHDVPTIDDEDIVFTRYKIPQPAPVDLLYDVTMFAKYQVDMNRFDEIMVTKFSGRQEYLNINGHFLPYLKEGVSDTDDLDDVDGEKLYKTVYEMRVQAYIQNEDEFEVVKTTKIPKISIGL